MRENQSESMDAHLPDNTNEIAWMHILLLWCSACTRFRLEVLLLTIHSRTSVFIKYFKTMQSEVNCL